MEQAYHKWPIDGEVIILYAKRLGEYGELSEALAALLEYKSEEFSPEYIHFAVKLLMHLWLLDNNFSDEIVEFAQKIYMRLEDLISEDTRDLEFELDLADLNLLSGDYDRGFNIYHSLMDIHDEKISYLHWRIHRGLAILAAHANNFDAALAALNTAIQEQP